MIWSRQAEVSQISPATLGITVALAVGAVIGRQFGALLSRRVAGHNIIRLLAIALAAVGIRLLL